MWKIKLHKKKVEFTRKKLNLQEKKNCSHEKIAVHGKKWLNLSKSCIEQLNGWELKGPPTASLKSTPGQLSTCLHFRFWVENSRAQKNSLHSRFLKRRQPLNLKKYWKVDFAEFLTVVSQIMQVSTLLLSNKFVSFQNLRKNPASKVTARCARRAEKNHKSR